PIVPAGGRCRPAIRGQLRPLLPGSRKDPRMAGRHRPPAGTIGRTGKRPGLPASARRGSPSLSRFPPARCTLPARAGPAGVLRAASAGSRPPESPVPRRAARARASPRRARGSRRAGAAARAARAGAHRSALRARRRIRGSAGNAEGLARALAHGYPLLAAARHEQMLAALAALQPKSLFVHELRLPRKTSGLLGSGLAWLNPPWQVDELLGEAVDWAAALLDGRTSAKWLIQG